MEASFFAARSHVGLKKQQSIRHMELCESLTVGQLSMVVLTRELILSICSLTLWSDSPTVLTWLHSDSCCYKGFIGNRVAEIQELSESRAWRYVPSRVQPKTAIKEVAMANGKLEYEMRQVA